MTISETPLCLAPVLFHIHSEFKDMFGIRLVVRCFFKEIFEQLRWDNRIKGNKLLLRKTTCWQWRLVHD